MIAPFKISNSCYPYPLLNAAVGEDQETNQGAAVPKSMQKYWGEQVSGAQIDAAEDDA